MLKPSSLRHRLLGALAIAALSIPCWAQEGNIRTVLFVKLLPGRADSWSATVKEYAAVMKKAGVDNGFTVWDSQTGPSQHAVVFYSKKWGEMDQDDPKTKPVAADVARLMSRLDSDTQSLEVWIDELQPDMVIPSQEIPKMVRTGRTRVIASRMDEVMAIFKNEVFPAAKKSGVSSFGIAVARFGTPTNEVHSYMSLNGWGDFDGPVGVQKAMGAAGYKAFLAKIQPLLEGTEWTVWKFQPELSYIPAK